MTSSAMISRLIRKFGKGHSVSLRRFQGLRTDVAIGVPSLTVSGAYSPGASVVTVSGVGVRGTLPAGLGVTLGGTPYVLSAEVVAEGDDTLVLPLASPLSVALSDGASVGVSDYFEVTAPTARTRATAAELANDRVTLETAKYSFSADDLGTFVPADNDFLIDGAETYRVSFVTPYRPGATHLGYAVFAEVAA